MISYNKFILGILTTSLLLSCGGGDKHARKAAPKGPTDQTINFCMTDTFSDIDPGSTAVSVNAVNISAVHDGLVGFKKQKAMIEPRLAEKWEISEDGLEYTFHLRPGVKFQTTDYFTPTRNMNADDVIFSYMRQIDKKSPYYRKKYTMIKATGIDRAIKEIKKIDNYTVKFILKKPMATFLSTQMASYVFAIVSKEYYEKMYKAGKLEFVYNHPVGTGPFIFVEKKEGKYTHFKRNPNYWRTVVKPANLMIKVILSTGIYLNETDAGKCDLTFWINPADIKHIKQYHHVKLLKQPVLRTWHTQINYKKHPEYNNPLVMKAIAHAINKQAIVKQAFTGHAQVATSLIPPAMFGHIEQDMNFVYDVDKAKMLLSQAGHYGGQGLSELTYLVRDKLSQYHSIAKILKEDLAKIGIKLNLKTMEWHNMVQQLNNHTYDMMSLSWGADFPDPDNFYSSLLGEYNTNNNYPNWQNDEYQRIQNRAQTTSNAQERLSLYKDLTKIYAVYMPIIPLIYSHAAVLLGENVHGYYVGPMDNNDALTEVYKD